ncbi:hypothetical protein Prudu_005950, partial [Prunus dulcis]
ARIGAVTKKLWSKYREGQNGNLAKKSDFIPPSLSSPRHFLSPPSLSFARFGVVRPFAFQGTARPPQAEPISAVGTYGSTFVSPSQPDRSQPRGPLSWPENHVFRRRFLQSHPNFQLEILLRFSPNRSSKASEVQPISMRKLQRAVEGRGIHHRANHSFRAKVKSFGVGQNTGETLPNFRQKSKEI